MIVKFELAFFPQHQRGDSSNRLGHREDAINRVISNRLVVFAISQTTRSRQSDFSFSSDRESPASK